MSSPGVAGQGLADRACPTTPARSRAARGHQGNRSPGHRAPSWGGVRLRPGQDTGSWIAPARWDPMAKQWRAVGSGDCHCCGSTGSGAYGLKWLTWGAGPWAGWEVRQGAGQAHSGLSVTQDPDSWKHGSLQRQECFTWLPVRCQPCPLLFTHGRQSHRSQPLRVRSHPRGLCVHLAATWAWISPLMHTCKAHAAQSHSRMQSKHQRGPRVTISAARTPI